MTAIFLLALLFGSPIIVNGLHFLGGTITWHPLNASATGTPVDIVIIQTYSWTYSRITCTSADVAGNLFIPVGTYTYLLTQTLDCISNCIAGSAGYVAPNVIPRCTDISAPIGTIVGQRSDIVTLQTGDDFSAAFQQSAWRPLATAASAAWSISTTFIIAPRSDNGLYNNAPVATMMSPVYIPVNNPMTIFVPVADADGDRTVCRWSTSSNGVDECGDVCPPGSLPPNTVIYPNCTIVITGQNIGDWFAVTLMVEDFINSSSTIPLSSVPVQFLVEVVGPPACPISPQIVGIPVEQSCTPLEVGQLFESELIAINNCGPNVAIVDIATLSFAGMMQGGLTEENTTVYSNNLTWTPTVDQLGYQVMCAMAFDNQSAQSAQYCFTFYVSEAVLTTCPSYTPVTSLIITTTTIMTMTTTQPQKPSNINWPLIGSIIGLVLLAALILYCCLCWRYCCPPCGFDCVYQSNGPFELYHIDRCIDPDCPWSDMSSDRGIFTSPRKNYLIYNTYDENRSNIDNARTLWSDRLSSTISGSTERRYGLGIVCSPRSGSGISMANGPVRRKSTAGVSVSRIKIGVGAVSEANSGIELQNLRPVDDTMDFPLAKLPADNHVKVSRIQSGTKPRAHSFGVPFPEDNGQESTEKTIARRMSTGAVSVVRVTRVPSQLSMAASPSTMHYPRQSIVDNTIRLDTINETRESSRASAKPDRDKVSVVHIQSAHRQMATNERRPSQMDTIDLSLDHPTSKQQIAAENHTAPLSNVRVERIQTGKKNMKTETTSMHLGSIVEEIQRKKKHNKFSEIHVERLPRENAVKTIMDV